MSKKPVIIYGASGYTGRLVAEHMRQFGIPFIAAGRSKARVEEAMALVPGIETAEYDVVEVEHSVKALTELFRGTQVVCNTVGPFEYFGLAAVEACANANVHYLDSTGETSFMLSAKEKFSDAFAENGKILAPSTAYMYTPLEIAAHKVLETSGIDTLEALCAPTGTPTYGSTQTIFALFSTSETAFYIENRKRVIWPVAKGYEVNVPGMNASLFAHPWGGGSLPIIFESDPRVQSCKQLTAFTNRDLMEGLVDLQKMYEADIKTLPKNEQVTALHKLAEAMQAGMPPRENPLVHRNTDVVYGRGSTHAVQCIIRSFSPYAMTGMLHAATAHALLSGQAKTSGFTSACNAVGYEYLYGQLKNFGFVDLEIA